MLEYIFVPYVFQTRQKLELAMDHPAFDVIKTHRCDAVLYTSKSYLLKNIVNPLTIVLVSSSRHLCRYTWLAGEVKV